VEKVIIGRTAKRVDVYIDHLRERTWRDRDSIDFTTYVHSGPPGVSCREHGIIQVLLPWSERSSRFTLRFEAHAIEVFQSTDVKKTSGMAHNG
jgi:hypothetical protein